MTAFLARLSGAIRRRLPRRKPRPRFRRGADVSIAVPFDYRPSVAPGRYAVVIHLYYTDMAGEFRDLCANIPGTVDLYVSTDAPDKRAAIARAFDGWDQGAVDIRVAPNRGRDMMAKFVTFRGDLVGYDLVLFLHSKKSLYLSTGASWRDVLLQSLVGDPAVVDSILALFASDERLGVVFPQHYEGIRDRLGWGGNRRRAGELADRLGMPLRRARALDFVSGSMFWARPGALAPLWSLALTPDDFEPEDGQLDATIAHALERLILYGAEHAGFHWLKVARRPLYVDTPDILAVPSAADLAMIERRARFRLLR